MPANGKPYALNLYKGVIYTSSAQGCGGVANAFYSFDLATRKAAVFTPAGGGMWGRRGVAIDADGTVYMGTGDAPFNPHGAPPRQRHRRREDSTPRPSNCSMVDFFAPGNANWMWRRDLDVNVTPVAFDFRGRKFLVGTSKECRLWLLDRENLGGEDHRTPLDTSLAPLQRPARRTTTRASGAHLRAWQDG